MGIRHDPIASKSLAALLRSPQRHGADLTSEGCPHAGTRRAVGTGRLVLIVVIGRHVGRGDDGLRGAEGAIRFPRGDQVLAHGASAPGESFAKAMPRHLLGEVRARWFTRVSLESGSQADFEPARRVCADQDIRLLPALRPYREAPPSVFMTPDLGS